MIKILEDLLEERRKHKEAEIEKKKQLESNLAEKFLIEQGIICKDCLALIGYEVGHESLCTSCQRDKNINEIIN